VAPTLSLSQTAVTPVSENRTNIKRNSTPLRTVISTPEFVKHFGEAKPDPKGSRRNIFGFEDELKVAPKGVDKAHKCVVLTIGKPRLRLTVLDRDIDLLKCRTFAVVYKYGLSFAIGRSMFADNLCFPDLKTNKSLIRDSKTNSLGWWVYCGPSCIGK
jgi:hypothetical protein